MVEQANLEEYVTARIVEGMLRDARQELENGDRIEASEKVWEAIGHTLKAVAVRRGWKYETHADAYPVIRRLVNETGDRKLRFLFYSASYVHRNYWIDAIPMADLRDWLADADEFIAMLDEASRG